LNKKKKKKRKVDGMASMVLLLPPSYCNCLYYEPRMGMDDDVDCSDITLNPEWMRCC